MSSCARSCSLGRSVAICWRRAGSRTEGWRGRSAGRRQSPCMWGRKTKAVGGSRESRPARVDRAGHLAARRGTARPRRFRRVIDRPCRADRVGFGDGLRPRDALLERGAAYATAQARITVEPRDTTHSVDDNHHVLGIGLEDRSGSVASGRCRRAGVRRRTDHRARKGSARAGGRGRAPRRIRRQGLMITWRTRVRISPTRQPGLR